MTAMVARLRAIASHAAEPLLGGLVLNVLYPVGLAGHLPLWGVDGLLAICAAYQQPQVQRRLTGGDPYRRLWPRLAVHLALYTAILLVVGWGPLSGLALIGTLSIHLRWAGSAVWWPAAVLGTSFVVAGQVLIALGWVYSFLPLAEGHAIAAIVTVTAVLVSRLLGLAVAQRERAERNLRLSEERFRTLIQHSADMITVTDGAGLIDYVSPAGRSVTGYPPGDLLGTDFFALVHPDDGPAAHAACAEVGAGPGAESHVEIRLRHADGEWRWHEAHVRNLLEHPAVRGVVINHRDVTGRRADREQLLYDASHDTLTGLANRAAFWRLLEESLRRTDDVAVLYLDLDGFKQVNDALGHEAGDLLLVAFGERLRRCALGADLVARLGGDEFGVLLTGARVRDNAIATARRIVAELGEPFLVTGRPVYGQASAGIAVAGPECASASVMLHRADLAMYHAKRQKADGWQVYVDGLADGASSTAVLQADLRNAVRAGQLRLQYQPVVALATGALTGLEVLVRWEHPTRGWLPPTTFVPLAEAQGIIGELGQWVLENACAQVVAWQRRLPPGRRLALSVNLSPRELQRDSLVDRVLDTLRRTGFDPAGLVLEVTETALVDEAAIPRLAALGGHGVRIALDDFGTGYSSLRHLSRLPVDIVKLDRCFVAELNGTKEGAAVAEAVIRLSQVLKLETVAEGIENGAQADELLTMGYDTGQGYHFARPLHARDVDALLANPAVPGRRPAATGTAPR